MAADIRIRRGRITCKNCQAKGEEMKGRGKEKREKRAGEEVSLARGHIEVPFGSALSGASERRRCTGIHAQLLQT